MKIKLHLSSILLFVALLNLTLSSAQQDGSVDPSFNPVDVGWYNRLTGSVYEMKEQSDGKVLVVGQISHYLGQPVNNIIRLNADETIDTSFNPGSGTNGIIQNVLQLPDGKILITGEFSIYNGTARKSIARLNSDGSLDTTFNGNGIMADGIWQPRLLPDGKIVIIYYTEYSHKVARLNTDGSLDIHYNIGNAIDTHVSYIDIDSNGRVLASGRFSGISESSPYRLIRLHTNGTQDAGFNVVFTPGSTYGVNEFVIQQNGKIVVLEETSDASVLYRFNENGTIDGSFQMPANFQGGYLWGLRPYINDKLVVDFYGIKILNSDGSLDTSFITPESAGLTCVTRGISQTGKIYVIGGFVSINGVLDNGMARLNPDGSRDNTFSTGPGIVTGADSTIGKILKQEDNKFLISGTFQSYNGVMRNRIARLNEDGTLDNSFILDSSINALSLNILSLYPGGKILIFNEGRIKRINSDGSLDTSFNTEQFIGTDDYMTADISDALLLPSGKIIVAGYFTKVGSIQVESICRLNSDGTFDATFSSNVLNTATVVKIIHLPQEQKILVGSIGAPSALTKIDYNGFEDPAFNQTPTALMFWLESFAVESDGKILAVGYGDGVPYYKQRLIRFNANGTVNQVMLEDDYGVNIQIRDIIASSDGKYYVLGRPGFIPLAGANFARFNNDGTLDNTFVTAVGANINDVIFQGNKIVVAGAFNNYNGVTKNNIIGVHTSGFLGNDEFQPAVEKVLIYRHDDNFIISAETNIQSVDIFDLHGRLISKTNDVNNASTSMPVVQRAALLIVKVTLDNGAVVTKKIY